MTTLFLSKRANQELLDSHFFYEDHQSNLGERFLAASCGCRRRSSTCRQPAGRQG